MKAFVVLAANNQKFLEKLCLSCCQVMFDHVAAIPRCVEKKLLEIELKETLEKLNVSPSHVEWIHQQLKKYE